MLDKPKINVLLKPSPQIGNNFSNEKFFKFPTNKRIILNIINGKINAVVFIVELNPNLLVIAIAIINKRII